MTVRRNADDATVAGFGDEWRSFDQSVLGQEEGDELFAEYFAIFPWEFLPPQATGFDMGCGSGRWARRVAPRVGRLHCVDAAAAALAVAQRNLEDVSNVIFHHASIEESVLPERSMDFGYSLGVLHHVPDTQAGIEACVSLLKPGAPLLVYLYYAFDNRPAWYRWIWSVTDPVRRVVSRSPHAVKLVASAIIALLIYQPLARAARVAAILRAPFAEHMPLAYYARRSLYTMRTDAYDRFATRLEQRFSRAEIVEMLTRSGLKNIRFSERAPFWCAVGFRRTEPLESDERVRV